MLDIVKIIGVSKKILVKFTVSVNFWPSNPGTRRWVIGFAAAIRHNHTKTITKNEKFKIELAMR